MKKKKGLIVLVCVLVLFVGLYFVLDSGVLEKKPDTSSMQDDIPQIDLNITQWPSPAITIALENATGRYTYDHRTSAGWKCLEHDKYPLDEAKMNDMAAILGKMTATRRLVKNADNMELFGLNNPIATVSFASATGLSATLTIGMQNTTTTDYYVHLNGVDAIFMMASSYVDYFLTDLISNVIVPEFPEIAAAEVKKAVYEAEGISFSATRLISNNSAHAGLMNAINSMYVSSVVDPYTEDLAQYGLDDPDIVASFIYEKTEGGVGRGEKEFTIKIGDKDPADDRYRYITLSDYPNTVYRIFYMSLDRLLEAGKALPKQ